MANSLIIGFYSGGKAETLIRPCNRREIFAGSQRFRRVAEPSRLARSFCWEWNVRASVGNETVDRASLPRRNNWQSDILWPFARGYRN